ncbi:LsmAD domain [Phytophthora cactorum]|nr:LsmAD domain [Phytophthora cactorum]
MQTTTAKPAGQAVARKNNSAGNSSKSKKKKPQQPKTNGNGKEAAEPAPAGPRPVVPPPVSGPWVTPNPRQLVRPHRASLTVLPSLPQASAVGCHLIQVSKLLLTIMVFFILLTYCRCALETAAASRAVRVPLLSGQSCGAAAQIRWCLDCVDPDDFSVVLKSTKRLSSGPNAKPFEDGSTVIFRRHQLAHLVADGSVNYTDGVFASGAAVSGGFRTDTEISGQKGEHLFGRELEAASSWLDPALDTGALEDSAANGRRKNQGKAGWNQFEANEKLFGVVSTYDENIYTTKLDKTKISTEQSRAAEKLAQEIERQSAAGNFHLQEERGQSVRGGKLANDLDEEARYSSVDRRGAPASGNAYVPPALRDAQRQSSGGKSQAKVTKTASTPAPPSEPAPPAADVPAPAPPAAPAAPKPLSFSEAVTGRSAAAVPAATPKEALKSQPYEKKGISASPKKEAAPAQVNGKDVKPAAAKAKGSPTKKDTSTGKDKKTAETKTENKSTSKTTTTTTTTAKKEETPKATPKKGLNPNAKEFKLSASAAEFTPSFSMPPSVKEHVSSPYRGGSPGHVPYPHPGMGYPPPMQEEWMYDSMGGEEGGEMGMPPYGYGVPMMYPPMMPQQNMRMMGGQRGGYGYQQHGYNPQGYYSPPNGGFPPYAGVGPQPPLPPRPAATRPLVTLLLMAHQLPHA